MTIENLLATRSVMSFEGQGLVLVQVVFDWQAPPDGPDTL